MIWKIRGRTIEFGRTLIMGILNVTPDSFSDGGLFKDEEAAAAHAETMVVHGADILDLGAESTRPNAAPVDAKEELSRLLPVLRRLRKQLSVPISIDTTKAEVARACIDEGADIINDVSSLEVSGREMADAVKASGCGLILMHMRGTPQTMQTLTSYANVTEEVLRELKEKLERALSFGVKAEVIALDPGLGFAKTAEQNLELIQSLERFHALSRPLLLGPSRKSFIGKVTGAEPEHRDFGTAAVAVVSVLKGIHIMRVHNVPGMRDVIKMTEALQGVKHVRT